MEGELRVGLAGLGAAARQVAPGFEKVEGVKFAAAADVRPEALDQYKQSFGVATFGSVEEMCRSADIDAVYVATPNDLHAEHALIAAEHGKHVICEKPMAITLDEANRMVEVAERQGVRYVQGHSKIYRPAIKKMGEVIGSGRLGRVIQINAWNYNNWLRRPWEAASLDPKRGGGVVYRQGPHQLDIVRYLGGGVVRSVRGTAGRWNPHFDVEGDFSAFLEFDNGATALLAFNGYGFFDSGELTWARGEGGQRIPDDKLYGPRPTPTAPVPTEEFYRMERFTAAATDERQSGDRAQDFFGITIVSCEHGDIRQSEHGLYIYTDEGREEMMLSSVPTHRGAAEVAELKAALEGNRPVFPGADWGRATLETCVAILESSREHREIQLRHQTPSPIQVPVAQAIP